MEFLGHGPPVCTNILGHARFGEVRFDWGFTMDVLIICWFSLDDAKPGLDIICQMIRWVYLEMNQKYSHMYGNKSITRVLVTNENWRIRVSRDSCTSNSFVSIYIYNYHLPWFQKYIATCNITLAETCACVSVYSDLGVSWHFASGSRRRQNPR